MPFLIAQLDMAEVEKIRSAGFEILAEGSLDTVGEFFRSPRGGGPADTRYAVIWLEGDPLETLGLRD